MKKVPFFFLVISAVFLCTVGCKFDPRPMEALPTPVAEMETTGEELHLAKFSSGQGYYSVEPYRGHSAITYADYATRQHIILCGRPECEHKDNSCTAYPPYGDAQTPPVLRVVNNKLLIIQTSASETAPPEIWSAELDGSNVSLMCKFPSNWAIDERIYTDEKQLYFFAEQVDHATMERTLLIIGVDTTSGQYETLYEISDQEMRAFILTAFERNLVLETLPLSNTGKILVECRLFNVDTRVLSEPRIQVDNDEMGILGIAQNLYIVDPEKADITIENMARDQRENVSYAKLYDWVDRDKTSRPLVFHAFDDWFRFEFILSYGTKKNVQEFIANIQTGEFHEMTLDSSYNGNPILILDEVGNTLFVRADWVVEGDETNPLKVIPQYAFISKQDYSASNPNYQYFALLNEQ